MNRIAAFALAATIGLGSMTAMADDNVKKNDAARDKQADMLSAGHNPDRKNRRPRSQLCRPAGRRNCRRGATSGTRAKAAEG